MKKTMTTTEGTKIGEINYNVIANYWNGRTYRVFGNRNILRIVDHMRIQNIFEGHNSEFAHFYSIISNMNKENVVCRYDSHNKFNIPLHSKAEIYESLGIKSKATGANLYSFLKSRDLIREVKKADGKAKLYYVNPAFAMKDSGVRPELYHIFSDYLDNELPELAIRNRKILSGEIAQFTPKEIFEEMILKNKTPRTYQLQEINGKTAMVSAKPDDDNDIYFCVNGTETYKKTKPRDLDITEYVSWYLDLDAGKDEFGNYYTGKELGKRKTAFRKIINLLPKNTAVVETRNGYHVYYACEDVTSESVWRRIQNRLLDVAAVADPAVKEPSRLMRLPGTYWMKDKSAPFLVSVISAEKITWKPEDLEKNLENSEAGIKKFLGANQGILKRVYCSDCCSDKNNITTNSCGCQLSEKIISRISAIQNLDINDFEIPKEQEIISGDIIPILKKKDLRAFLGLNVPLNINFNCVFHNDRHPSARIKYTEDKGYAYTCFADGCQMGNHDYDILNIVEILSSRSKLEAILFLEKVYNLKRSNVA